MWIDILRAGRPQDLQCATRPILSGVRIKADRGQGRRGCRGARRGLNQGDDHRRCKPEAQASFEQLTAARATSASDREQAIYASVFHGATSIVTAGPVMSRPETLSRRIIATS